MSTLHDAKDIARSRGFIAVRTAAGTVLFSKWFPYGLNNEDEFEFRIDRDELRDGPRDMIVGRACGLWRLLNGVTMEDLAHAN